ncbi:MAG: DUF885 domain-containing protein [Acidobacteriota bacterium]|nr:DUF885 domain-containing protein [Acidobacteriota bacterium]
MLNSNFYGLTKVIVLVLLVTVLSCPRPLVARDTFESRGPSQWPNGAEVYGVLLRLSTTTEIDPKQVQDFGLQEVKRIREEMAALVPRTGLKGSLDEFLVHARSDPEFYFSNGEQLLAAYRGAIRQIEPFLPNVIHDVPKLNIQVEGVHGGAAASHEAPNSKYAYDLVNVEIGDLAFT